MEYIMPLLVMILSVVTGVLIRYLFVLGRWIHKLHMEVIALNTTLKERERLVSLFNELRLDVKTLTGELIALKEKGKSK